MRYIKRQPKFSVTISRPRFDRGQGFDRIAVFASGQKTDAADLLGYQFSESLQSVETQFTLTVTPEIDSDGKSMIDRVEPRDVVIFSEFDTTRFVGVVSRVRYSGKMDDTPNRSITITGMNMGGLLRSFQIVMDQRMIATGTTLATANTQLLTSLQDNVDEDASVKRVLTAVYESFMNLSAEVGGHEGSAGLGAILNRWVDYETGIAEDQVALYPIKFTLYTARANDIWTIWEGIVQKPFQELYGRWNEETDMYAIYFRETPFSAHKWSDLRVQAIDPLYVRSVEIGKSDDDVYTFYATQLLGSSISRDQTMVISAYRDSVIADQDNWPKYGFRPLEMEFRYFDPDYFENEGAALVMRQVNEMVFDWYSKNPEFLNGTIEMMTMPDSYPRIGEKVRYLGGEFYVEETSRSWQYGGPMTTSLSVTRGYRYDENGNYIGPITNIGRFLKQQNAGDSV